MVLSENLSQVEERIHAACARAGRSRSSVTLIAVTKVFPAQAIVDAYALGLRDFGENYVQEFDAKAPGLPELPGARFHLIGHLQSNKSRRATDLFQVIQTVDTPRLAQRLHEQARWPMEVFLEVKLSGEEAKHGAAPESLPVLMAAVRGCSRLQLSGLMTMPPWSEDPEDSRPYFRRLRELADAHHLPALSMGMSNDFEAAIEEGATHVRIGTALFGKRVKR